MKKLFPKIFIPLSLLVLIFMICSPASLALDVEYEFLTPQVVVLKSDKMPKLSNAELRTIQQTGYWFKENALLRDNAGNIKRKPDTTCYFYIVLKEPFKPGEKRRIAGVFLHYDPEKPSNIFKLNQLGNGENQPRKFAYMGAWLGSAGALELKHLAGKEFELRRSQDGKCVYKNVIKMRRDDPAYKNKTAFTGEEVAELDYSNFKEPGKYYLFVENIGRSMEFAISSATLNEAFYIHARGLYHKRCGIAKSQEFTAWTSPACHTTVQIGRFPGNAEHYRKGKNENDRGFFDRKGNRLEVKHFDLIKDNPPYKNISVTAPGGWHDAADYDRRPYHLRIVSDLAMTYLLKPQNFIDGQLNIPESGNHIPDILDEAAWGLQHLLAVQQPDGGVGTWFETIGHPQAGEGLPDKDPRTYYVSAASRNGTLEYAAAASTLALAMKKSGADTQAEKYLTSAIKAWHFANNKMNRLIAYYQYQGQMISYMEEPELYGENLLKTAVNLFILTGEEKYLEMVLIDLPNITQHFNKDFWRWSPLTWMVLELYPVKALSKLQAEYRKAILREADKMLNDQENAYPYRTLWHAHDAGWVHAMAWGNYHPLRRAMMLVAAHKLTGEQKYLTGIYLANDFHNGANPLGRSMTSGLGKVYPAVFLDLPSYADNIGEFVPGITPYGNTFGLDRNAAKMVYKENAEKLPIFRRYTNLEFLSVPSSEYSVWETIAPAAAVTGYLIEKPALPTDELKKRKPAGDFRKLPGYRALP